MSKEEYMKKMVMVLFVAALAAFLAHPAAVLADEEIGEFAAVAPLPSQGAPISPGHYALLASYFDQYLSSPRGAVNGRWQWAGQLMDGIDDPAKADEITDFFIVDVRVRNEYCGGHIAGAINIPLAAVAKPENLAILPTDKPLLLVCTTAHQGTAAGTVLGTLGYDVSILRFGMSSWQAVTTTKITSPVSPVNLYGLGLPVEKCQ
jgi:rhodanese-related sulfurtransferase